MFAAVAFVVAGVAGGAGYAVGAARTPDIVATAAAPHEFPVTMGAFADPHQVNVTPTAGPAVTIVTHRAGTLTGSSCLAGSPIRSGTTPWAVDDAPLLALATAEPLYRNLSEGSRGADVKSLQDELVRLGYSVEADGVYGGQTGRAVSAIRQANGMGKGTTLGLSDVVWLSTPAPVMASCAALGAELAVGQTLGDATPTLVAARVNPMPTALVPGARTLAVGDLTLAVDGSGAVGEQDLLALGSLPQTALALATVGQSSPVQLSGTLTLTDPLTTATVPASAIVVDGSTACVAAGGLTIPVQVVSSQLGQSVIRFGEAVPPKLVDIQPDPSLTCG